VGAVLTLAALGTSGAMALTASSAAADICFMGTCIKEPSIPVPPTIPPKIKFPPVTILPPMTIPPVLQNPPVPPTTTPPATTPPSTGAPTTNAPTTVKPKSKTPKPKNSTGTDASSTPVPAADVAAPAAAVESAVEVQGGSVEDSAQPAAPISANIPASHSTSTMMLVLGLIACLVLLAGGVGGLIWHRRQA